MNATELVLAMNVRAKFVDENNYNGGAETMTTPALIEEVEQIIAGLPSISRLSSLISTLSEEMENLGFSVRHKVRKFFETKTGRESGEIPIVCSKFGSHIALAICETKPTPSAARILLGSKFDGRIIIIRKPSDYVKELGSAPPPGIDRQLFLNQRDSSAIRHAIPEKSAAAKGTRVGGIKGGQGVGEAPGRILSSSKSFAFLGRASSKPLRASARAKNLKPGRGPKLDWSAIDRYGNPVVSFDPGHPLHARIVKVLSEESSPGPLRKVVLGKLVTETSRIYERYRRSELKSRGFVGGFIVPANQQPKLERIAIGCISLGITPRQVLEFWHSRVADYTHGQVQLPGLGFLSQFANLDAVACSGVGTVKTAKAELRTAEDRNPFSALTGLDVKLRGALERAGFDTTVFNDRYLLSVQHNAIAIASGKNLFVADVKFGKMIRFAAENLYKVA